MSEMPEPSLHRIQTALIPFLRPRRDLIARRRKICWSSERQSQKNQSKVKCSFGGFQWNLLLVIFLTSFFRMFKAWEKLAAFEIWQRDVRCVLGLFAVFLLHIGRYYFFHYLCADWSRMLWANMQIFGSWAMEPDVFGTGEMDAIAVLEYGLCLRHPSASYRRLFPEFWVQCYRSRQRKYFFQ